ncbi:cysteine protease ATG4 [Sporobolomyces koalae]|uniref:cysteine protease ATG4 n=1 Tax=Sporobolomyces koalae TaxID=500713 RepID=UPI00317465E1
MSAVDLAQGSSRESASDVHTNSASEREISSPVDIPIPIEADIDPPLTAVEPRPPSPQHLHPPEQSSSQSTKWYKRSPASSSSSLLPLPDSQETKQSGSSRLARSLRSRSVGSISLLNASPSPTSEPVSPRAPSPGRPATASSSSSSRPPLDVETRRGSATSTSTLSSSPSSTILHFAASLKPSSPHGRRKSSSDSTRPDDEAWSSAHLDHAPTSENMTKTLSNSSSSKASVRSGEGGGKFVQSLRKTRSKLGLLGSKGKEEARVTETNISGDTSRTPAEEREEEEEDGMMVQSPVLTVVEPPSPSDSRKFSQEFGSLNDKSSLVQRPEFDPATPSTSRFFGPGSAQPQASPTGTTATQKIGGWFSSMIHNNGSSSANSSPSSSPEKLLRSRGSSHTPSSTFSASPTKKLSTSSLSLPPSGSLTTSPSTSSRLGPLDRMLDKAVQYFLDTDSSVDKCPDDIWVLGVKHEGWRPSLGERDGATTSEIDSKRKRSLTGGSASSIPAANGTRNDAPARRWSPVKSRATNTKRQREMADRNSSPRAASPTPSFRSVSTNLSGESSPLPSSFPSDDPVASTINGWPAAFYADFYSRPALTYRTNFPSIPCSPAQPSSAQGAMQGMFNSLSISIGRGGRSPARDESGLNSDTGWGCMLRTGQSLLANALITAHLGRDWRRPIPPSSLPIVSPYGQPAAPLSHSTTLPPLYTTYTRILSLFLDTPSASSPFSIHKFALEGQRLGKSVGEWFGPSTAAGAIRKLVNEFEPAGMRVVNCVDGTLYENEVVAASTKDTKWDTKVLVLINLRLGIDGVNPIYHEAIKGIFRIPQSVGIAGGRPSSSYYFVGSQANSLYYIDPHHPRPAVSTVALPSELEPLVNRIPLSRTTEGGEPNALLDTFFATAYDDSAWRTYHCDKVRKCSLSSLDPSMLVGFLVQDERDWEDFKIKVRELGQSSTAIFSIAAAPPKWMRRTSSMALNATNVPTSVSPGEDSFSELDEDSIVDRPTNPALGGPVLEDQGDFSEPEGWELDSTDASDTNSLSDREGPATSTHERRPDDRSDDEEVEPVFVDSRTSLRSRESTRGTR